MRFGSVPERFRCKATARGTGQRCRQATLQGGVCCRHHGGHALAYKTQRKLLGKCPLLVLPPIRLGRAMLAKLGAGVDKSVSPSILERGKRLLLTINGLGMTEKSG